MILLDTDLITILHGPASPAQDRLVQRLRAADAAGEDVVVSIVSFEEQMRGWMSVISRSRDAAVQVPAYERLHRLLDRYHEIGVLDFDARAAAPFQSLRDSYRRANTMDLKIAAIAITHDALLLSGNARDFASIAEVRFEAFRT